MRDTAPRTAGSVLICERCGLRPRHTRLLCQPCRQRERYAADPDFRARRQLAASRHYRSRTPEQKERILERVSAYNRRHPAERHAWVDAWRRRTGRALPVDLVGLRRAVKALDAAIQTVARAQDPPGLREPGA